jgi:ectoine hydroxylase-related dioxygenase (phytanoyl-CoA dioxygenase family)
MSERAPERQSIDPALIEAYERDGAVRVPHAFSRAWTERLRRRFDEMLTAGRAGTLHPGITFNAREGRAGVRYAARYDSVFEEWMRFSPAAHLVAQITRSKQVRFWFDLFFYKEGGAPDNATPWHHDVPAFCFKGLTIPSLWIALTDVDERNAPLITYRGSHTATDIQFRPPTVDPAKPLLPGYRERDFLLAEVQANPDRVQIWPCEEGDCLLIHPYTWHASLPQIGETRRRIAYTSRWLGDGCAWDVTEYSFVDPWLEKEGYQPGDAPRGSALPLLYEAAG